MHPKLIWSESSHCPTSWIVLKEVFLSGVCAQKKPSRVTHGESVSVICFIYINLHNSQTVLSLTASIFFLLMRKVRLSDLIKNIHSANANLESKATESGLSRAYDLQYLLVWKVDKTNPHWAETWMVTNCYQCNIWDQNIPDCSFLTWIAFSPVGLQSIHLLSPVFSWPFILL